MKLKNGKRKYQGHFLFAYFKNERNHRNCHDVSTQKCWATVLFCQLYFPFFSLSLEFQRGIDTGLHEIQTLQMELDFTWFYICSFDQLHPRRRRGHQLSLIQKTPMMKAPRKLRHWGPTLEPSLGSGCFWEHLSLWCQNQTFLEAHWL